MSTPENKEDHAAPDAGFGGLAHAIGTRIIILTMPAVFLVIVAAIIMVFGKPKGRAADSAGADRPAVADAEQEAPTGVVMPAGAAPGAIALDGDRLAVRLDGPDGVVVVVYDLEKGEVIARVPFGADD